MKFAGLKSRKQNLLGMFVLWPAFSCNIANRDSNNKVILIWYRDTAAQLDEAGRDDDNNTAG